MKSFANGTAFTLKTPVVSEQLAFDPNLTHNKIIGRRGDDPSTIIYSIDPNSILKTLNIGTEDSLQSLTKLTLATKSSNEGEAMWDTFFNFKNRESISACILMADAQYLPIGPHDTINTSRFLNLSMATSRVSLNRIRVGDKIGIALNDMMSQSVYVLLYHVHSQTTTLSTEKDVNHRAGRLAAVNIELHHAMRITYNGEVSLEDMNEQVAYSDAGAEQFVNWLFNAVMDIETAYPYKPHFSPIAPQSVKRKTLEDRIFEQREKALGTSYETFEDLCRTIYMREKEENRKQREQNKPQQTPQGKRRGVDKQRQNTPTRDLPVVEVVTLSEHVLVKFTNEGFNTDSYAIPRQQVEEMASMEYFLTNRDLMGILISESSKVTVLNEERFGKDAFVRYFQMNF